MTLDNDLLWIRLVITTCDNQPDGAGTLKISDGTVLLPNDLYPLPGETFRLYYTSASTDQQTVDVYFQDSFGTLQQLTFSFNNNSNKEDK